jgi:hypothetical protein
MLALSISEMDMPDLNLKTAKSLEIPWSKLKKMLIRGLRGADVTRYIFFYLKVPCCT